MPSSCLSSMSAALFVTLNAIDYFLGSVSLLALDVRGSSIFSSLRTKNDSLFFITTKIDRIFWTLKKEDHFKI